ncbi:MAG: hypothetical protein WC284_18375 [Candidimonas sp.]
MPLYSYSKHSCRLTGLDKIWWSWPPTTVILYHMANHVDGVVVFNGPKYDAKITLSIGDKVISDRFTHNEFSDFVIKQFGPCVDLNKIVYPGWRIRSDESTFILFNGTANGINDNFDFYHWDRYERGSIAPVKSGPYVCGFEQ